MSVEPKERWYDTILGPVVTEKSTQGSMYNQVTFKVRTDATKPQIKEAVEGLFEVKVRKVNTSMVKGKVKRGPRGRLGQALGLEEGDGFARRGRYHRRDDRALGDGTQELQADDAGAPPAHPGGPLRPLEGEAGQEADRRIEPEGRAQQRRPHHHAPSRGWA